MGKGKDNGIDRLFLGLVVGLAIFGFCIFISASLGLYAREGLSLLAVATRQLLFGLIGGLAFMYLFSHISYKFWQTYAVPIFIFSFLATAAVFIPGLGYSHGGATRWLDLGVFSFQPVELLKVGFVVVFAAWCSHVGDNIKTLKQGVAPFLVLLFLVAGLLALQPDTGSFLVIGLAGIAMFIASGAKVKHIAGIIGAGLGGMTILAYSLPYIQERLLTFLNPASDPFGSGYQIQQSLIAVGSGRWFGRGIGQSIQKFNFVPEPVGDSIFAIFAEEWGFVGVVLLIGLFTALALRGYRIAADSKEAFPRLVVVGLVTLVAAQSFVNIGAMIGVLPLTGLPLIFVSHGGTALFTSLASIGIVLNISRYS